MQLSFLVLLVFGLAVVLFAVQNAGPVDVRFVTWQFREIPLAFVIVGSAAAGAVLMLLLGLAKQIGMSVRMWDTQARIKRLEGEIRQKDATIQKLETAQAKLESELEAARAEVASVQAELAARTAQASEAAVPEAAAGEDDGGKRPRTQGDGSG